MPGGYCGKSHKEIKRIKKFIAEVNQRFGEKFVEIPSEEIGRCQYAPEKAWRNKNYLVYLYHDREFLRLCVQRTTIKDDGSFEDGISWDRIQQIKSAVGFGDYWGLEVFPADKALVNISNIRHIWLFKERPAFAWSGEERVAVAGNRIVPPTLHKRLHLLPRHGRAAQGYLRQPARAEAAECSPGRWLLLGRARPHRKEDERR